MTKKSKDFSKDIIKRNDERAKLAREKYQNKYQDILQTADIPAPCSTEDSDNHNYSKKFNNKSLFFESTEGMSPSTTRSRITFTSRDRSFVKEFY
ncbi:hypothetical protein DICPUDRAFT_147825 [Dictyostelium purpureum]|uniref:Uncharacterized protein n=1 Tax=Dictyostelium purpureum TaxID=5786 RepID=F0Z9I2_DICPU|nr:uncharacterized protein DICPUDRAFT_147825 [Dictyostelium purpureum]EGC39388.1 hypothetical protein DICPUDRAFT_147825 [Dictyostelium purpureum]|eukprot:XP_003284062.1 hypothetical protein DICPUDRAFT_147825 [Dictyostelium purpureum]